MPCVGKAGDLTRISSYDRAMERLCFATFIMQVDASSVISRLCRAHSMQNNYRKNIMYSGCNLWVNDNLYAQVI